MRNEREQRREGFSRAEARSQVQSAVVLGMGWWGVGTMTFCTRAGKRITSQVKSSQVESGRVRSGQVRSGQGKSTRDKGAGAPHDLIGKGVDHVSPEALRDQIEISRRCRLGGRLSSHQVPLIAHHLPPTVDFTKRAVNRSLGNSRSNRVRAGAGGVF